MNSPPDVFRVASLGILVALMAACQQAPEISSNSELTSVSIDIHSRWRGTLSELLSYQALYNLSKEDSVFRTDTGLGIPSLLVTAFGTSLSHLRPSKRPVAVPCGEDYGAFVVTLRYQNGEQATLVSGGKCGEYVLWNVAFHDRPTDSLWLLNHPECPWDPYPDPQPGCVSPWYIQSTGEIFTALVPLLKSVAPGDWSWLETPR